MRVIVEKPGPDPQNTDPNYNKLSHPRIGSDLLCVVRDLLKKMGRRVLVGDKVTDSIESVKLLVMSNLVLFGAYYSLL